MKLTMQALKCYIANSALNHEYTSLINVNKTSMPWGGTDPIVMRFHAVNNIMSKEIIESKATQLTRKQNVTEFVHLYL